MPRDTAWCWELPRTKVSPAAERCHPSHAVTPLSLSGSCAWRENVAPNDRLGMCPGYFPAILDFWGAVFLPLLPVAAGL